MDKHQSSGDNHAPASAENQEGNSRHTPGPWKAMPEEADRDYIRIRGAKLGSRYKIANVIDFGDGYLDESLNDLETMETRANAHLIAAAPELLEALKSAQEVLACFVWPPPTGAISPKDAWVLGVSAESKVRAAIAKAEGREG